MTRKTFIIIIAAVICAACALLDAYDVVPRFKRLLGIIELPCFIFLFYTYYQYRKQASAKREAPSKLRILHAAAFNLLGRAFGVMATIVGTVFTFWGLSLVLDPKATIDVNGVPSSDPWTKASVLIIGLVAVTMGILFLKARPYQPKPLDMTMWPNTSLEPTPITPGSFRFGFPVGESHRRRGSVLGR